MVRKWICPSCGWVDPLTTNSVKKKTYKIIEELKKDRPEAIMSLLKKIMTLMRKHVYLGKDYYHEEYKFVCGVKQFPDRVISHSVRWFISEEKHLRGTAYSYLLGIMRREMSRLEAMKEFERKYEEKQPPKLRKVNEKNS